MSLGIWEAFRGLLGWGGSADEEADESRFVPSPLDISVRVAHGGGDDTVARELSQVDEQARELESTQRDS